MAVTMLLLLLFLQSSTKVSAKQYLLNPKDTWINNASATGNAPMPIFVSDSGTFSFGFIGSNNTGFYLSVFISTMSKGIDFTGVVWSANRDNAVTLGAVLEAGADNNLILIDSKGSSVWYTDVAPLEVVGVDMQESGNLVLLNAANDSLWQSFDHPTDTLLANQMLMPGSRLVSRAAENKLQEGVFSLRPIKGGLVLEATLSAKDNSSSPYWGWGLDASNPSFLGLQTSCGYDVAASVDGSGVHMTLADSTLQITSPCSVKSKSLNMGNSTTPPTMLVLRLDPRGDVQVFSAAARAQKYLLLSLFGSGPCKLPNECGYSAICEPLGSADSCSCPTTAGMEYYVNNSTSHPGCSPRTALDTSQCEGKRMVALGGGYQYMFSNFSSPVTSSSGDACQQMCLHNCSCVAAIYDQGSRSCFLVAHTLYTLQLSNSQHPSFAFIKVQESSASVDDIFMLPSAVIALAIVTLPFWL